MGSESLVDRFVKKYNRYPTEVDRDYLEMLQMSKYRIVDVPDVQPGKCGNCGSSKNDGRKYIDIGLHVDWYGALFLCGSCLLDLATNFGLFKVLENRIDYLKEQLKTQENIKAEGKVLLEDFKATMREVKDYFDAFELHPTGDGSSTNVSSMVRVDEESTVSGTSENEPGNSEAEHGTTKPATSTRPKNVPRLTDLLNTET